MLQRDYLMRLIKAVTEAIARIAGLAKAGRVADAEVELAEAFRSILGVSRADSLRLSPGSLVMVIGKERAGLAADLLDAEATVLDAQDRSADAASRRARAEAIRRAAA
jgi:hypothetical protein